MSRKDLVFELSKFGNVIWWMEKKAKGGWAEINSSGGSRK